MDHFIRHVLCFSSQLLSKPALLHKSHSICRSSLFHCSSESLKFEELGSLLEFVPVYHLLDLSFDVIFCVILLEMEPRSFMNGVKLASFLKDRHSVGFVVLMDELLKLLEVFIGKVF